MSEQAMDGFTGFPFHPAPRPRSRAPKTESLYSRERPGDKRADRIGVQGSLTWSWRDF
jgi:hypothetical protein